MALILVAEDEVVSRLVICEIIKKLGHVPLKAGNGQIAYDFLKDNADEIKVIITDLMMPQMDGYQLIEKINSNPQYKSIPIIVQSAYLGVTETAKLMEQGIDYVMTKPVDTADLEDYIKKLLPSS